MGDTVWCRHSQGPGEPKLRVGLGLGSGRCLDYERIRNPHQRLLQVLRGCKYYK